MWRKEKAGISSPAYDGLLIDTCLLWGTAIIFVIFTLVSTKLPHYTLPAFPLLALLLARHWHQGAAVESQPVPVRNHRGRNCVCVDRRCPHGAANGGAVFPAYQLFQVSRASLQPNMQFAAIEFQEPSLVWYFRSRVQGFLTPLKKRRAAEFMSASDPRFIVLPTPVAGELLRTHREAGDSLPSMVSTSLKASASISRWC